jgi:AcrR family transcriptional regulator
MRYEASYKAKTRSRIVKASAGLAKGHGFAASGVDQLMQAAGLSGSAFYKHFAGKAELLAAIVGHELQHSLAFFVAHGEAGTQRWLERTVQSYFSKPNLESAEAGCMLPSLASEVARADEATRATFEAGMQEIAEVVAARLQDPGRVWPVLAQLVGAVVLARAMAKPATRRRILADCRDDLCPSPARAGRSAGAPGHLRSGAKPRSR